MRALAACLQARYDSEGRDSWRTWPCGWVGPCWTFHWFIRSALRRLVGRLVGWFVRWLGVWTEHSDTDNGAMRKRVRSSGTGRLTHGQAAHVTKKADVAGRGLSTNLQASDARFASDTCMCIGHATHGVHCLLVVAAVARGLEGTARLQPCSKPAWPACACNNNQQQQQQQRHCALHTCVR